MRPSCPLISKTTRTWLDLNFTITTFQNKNWNYIYVLNSCCNIKFWEQNKQNMVSLDNCEKRYSLRLLKGTYLKTSIYCCLIIQASKMLDNNTLLGQRGNMCPSIKGVLEFAGCVSFSHGTVSHQRLRRWNIIAPTQAMLRVTRNTIHITDWFQANQRRAFHVHSMSGRDEGPALKQHVPAARVFLVCLGK